MNASELVEHIQNNADKFIKLLQSVGNLPITNTFNIQLVYIPILKDEEGNPLDGSILDSIISF